MTEKDRGDKGASPARAKRNGGAAKAAAVTLKDVARAAGVSPMTVSNVINGNAKFYTEETRVRVERSIAALNYRPLGSGRSLKSGRRQVIGVVIVDEMADFMSNPFMSRFVSGLCGYLSRNGYIMIVQGIAPAEFATSFAMRRAEADAYCMRLHGNRDIRADALRVLERIAEPIVLIQETLPVSRPDTCVVRQDDHGGGVLLAEHLIVRGVRHVALVVPEFSGPMTKARTDGLEEGYRAAGVELVLDVVKSKVNDFASGYGAVAAYINKRSLPQAVVGTNDELAMAALRALEDHNLDVPDRVRVVGFNGFQAPGYTRPSLTTMVSSASAIGEEAGMAMLGRLQTGAFAQNEIVLPVTFRKGQST